MKTSFEKKEILLNRRFFFNDWNPRRTIEKLSFINNGIIRINTILKSELYLSEKKKFIWEYCNLTNKELRDLAYKICEIILPIHENEFPKDERLRKLLDLTRKCYDGEVTYDELHIEREKLHDTMFIQSISGERINHYVISSIYCCGGTSYVTDTEAAEMNDKKTGTDYSQKIIDMFIEFFNQPINK